MKILKNMMFGIKRFGADITGLSSPTGQRIYNFVGELLNAISTTIIAKVSFFRKAMPDTQKDFRFIENNFNCTESELYDFLEKNYPMEKHAILYKIASPDLMPNFAQDGMLLTGDEKTMLKTHLFSVDLIKSAYQKANIIAEKGLKKAVLWSILAGVVFVYFSSKFVSLSVQVSNPTHQSMMSWGIVDESVKGTYSLYSVLPLLIVISLSLITALSILLVLSRRNERKRHTNAAQFISGVIESQTAILNKPTKDSMTRQIQRSKQRELEQFSRFKMLEQQNHIKNNARVLIGYATGSFKSRGSLQSPGRGQPIVMNGDDLGQGILVFGGTGSGKTQTFLLPLLRQLMGMKNEPLYAMHSEVYKHNYDAVPQIDKEGFKYGGFVMDAKGTFYKYVYQMAVEMNRLDDLVLIGTSDNNDTDLTAKNVNLLAGVSPSELSNIILSLNPAEGESADWKGTAANLISHVAVIAQTLSKLDESARKQIDINVNPYSISWIYAVASSDEKITKYAQIAKELIEKGVIKTNEPTVLQSSIDYVVNVWVEMATQTKASVIKNVNDLLGKLSFSEELNSKYGFGLTDENTIDMSEIFNGRKIFIFNLTTAKDGEVAAMIMKMLKAQFYKAALKRLEDMGAEHCARNPVFTMYDEAQEILTAGEGGVSDSDFWNKARETGVHAIVGTQTLSSLLQALGDKSTANFIDQMRTKIIFSNEDAGLDKTIDLVQKLAGDAPRAKIFDHQVASNGQKRGFESIDEIETELSISSIQQLADKPLTAVTDLQAGVEIDFSRHEFNQFESELLVNKGSQGGFFSEQKGGTTADDYAKQVSELFKRKRDKDVDFLQNGNDLEPLMPNHEVPMLSNWQAIAFVKQSGHMVKDIIRLKPEYEYEP